MVTGIPTTRKSPPIAQKGRASYGALAALAVGALSLLYLFTAAKVESFGSDTSTVMHVASGKPCAIPLRTGARSTFSGVTIGAPARNGSASASSSGVTYQSKPGFKGADSFAFTVSGTNASGPGKATVQVAVTVQ